ncbi:MAG: DUF1415 domain-containing protein [Cellvibrionaceae bacterium]
MKSEKVRDACERWLKDIVVGLQLCPFAKAPLQKKQIRFAISDAATEEQLIDELIKECRYLDEHQETETTLLICSELLPDFFEFCQFIQWAESSLKKHDWQGIYQLAHFHPHYCFTGCDPDDAQNLTNRSPYPILHLLRETSLEKALERFEAPESIPEKNIQTMNAMSEAEKHRYFDYLFN